MENAERDGQQDAPTSKLLKAIIMKENRLKDPFRIKKSVTFMIELDENDGENDSQEEDHHSNNI